MADPEYAASDDAPVLFDEGPELYADELEEAPRFDPSDEYWAAEPDSTNFASILAGKVRSWGDFTRSSSYFAWCRKAWKLYYNLSFSENEYEIGTVALGDNGELVGVNVGHLRNLIQHRLNLTTKERPALRCRAVNADLESQRQTELGQGLVDYYLRTTKAEQYLHNAVEQSLIFAEGFLVQTWNPNAGADTDGDPNQERVIREGDLHYENATPWNVVRDLGVTDWEDHKWIAVRGHRNKYELAAEFPEFQDAILSAPQWTEIPLEEGSQPFAEQNYLQETDEVEIIQFWHKDMDCLPGGRYTLVCGKEALLDLDMDLQDLPVHRCLASVMLLTPFGYAPAWDLIAVQELINSTVSAIASNQDAFANQKVYGGPPGNDVTVEEISENFSVIRAEVKPEGIDFLQPQPEVFKFLETLTQTGEYLAGVDSITRGQPQYETTSGAYAALLAAQSASFAGTLIRSYHSLIETVGTSMLRILKTYATSERVTTIAGKHNKIYQKHWTSDDLAAIDRVVVEITNPMLNTTAGKLQYAQMAVETGLVKDMDKLLEVFMTGQTDSLLEGERAQLSATREENELAIEGQEIPPPIPEDNHVLHLKEHAALFGSSEARQNPALRAAIQPHMMEHLQLFLTDPNTQILQSALYGMQMPAGGAPEGTGEPSELTEPPNPSDAGTDGRSAPSEPSEAPAPPAV